MASKDRSRSPRRSSVAAGRRILVTGAAGLLGQAVVEELAAAGHCVVGCDSAPQPDGQAAKYFQCDLSDAKALESACASCEAVIHLGGISGPGCFFDPPVPAARVTSTNINGTLTVLEVARICGAKRVVYASSVAVYWPVDEAKQGNVDSTVAYVTSKRSSEKLCRAHAAEGLVDTVSLRIAWVYGPRRRTRCVVKGLLQGEASGTPPRHCRDWVYVDDAAHALVLAALRSPDFGGTVLEVSGGYLPHCVIEGSVERALGKEVARKAPPDALQDPPVRPMDISSARRELGWEPRVPISEGVWRCAVALNVGLAAKRDLQPWLGIWRWDNSKCERAFEYYKFWGTMSDEEVKECATSHKEHLHEDMSEGKLAFRFKANDTTRREYTGYDIYIDGRLHDIDPELRSRANNSIKMNPTGQWAHWWEGDRLVMEQTCIVRGEELTHRLTRSVSGDALRCYEQILRRHTREEVLTAVFAFERATAV